MQTKLDKIPLLKLISQAVRNNVTERDATITIVLSPVLKTCYVYMRLKRTHTASLETLSSDSLHWCVGNLSLISRPRTSGTKVELNDVHHMAALY